MEKQHYNFYKITHVPTGMFYIGLTKKTVNERFISHMHNALNRNIRHSKMGQFIKEHPDVFEYKLELLDEGDYTYEEAELIEGKYIEQYDAINKGLNSSIYGGNRRFTDEDKVDMLDQYLNGKSLVNIARDYGVKRGYVYSTIRNQGYEHVYSQLQPPPFVINQYSLPFIIVPYRCTVCR